MFTKRIYDQKRRFMILTLEDPQVRVADVFLMLDESIPQPQAETPTREFKTTLDDIAHWAGMTPEAVRDVLSHFSTQRRVELFPEKIVVKNISDFQRFVNSRRKK
jgi:CRP-like cAMP-binding protein